MFSAKERILPAYVVVQVAHGKYSASSSEAALKSKEVERVLASHNAVIVPTPELIKGQASPFATVEVPDIEVAHKLAHDLRELSGIEAAYAKPGEETT